MQMDNDLNITLQKQLKTFWRQGNWIFLNSQFSHLICSREAFQFLKTKLKADKKPKQAATEGGCRKGLAKLLWGETLVMSRSSRLQAVMSCDGFLSNYLKLWQYLQFWSMQDGAVPTAACCSGSRDQFFKLIPLLGLVKSSLSLSLSVKYNQSFM